MSNVIPTFDTGIPLPNALAFLDAIDVAVMAVNSDMVITYWNRAATHLLGWVSDDAVDRPLSGLISADSELAAARFAVFTDAETWSGLFPFERNDATVVGVRLTFTPVRDGVGRIVGGVASMSKSTGVSTSARDYATVAPISAIAPRKRSTRPSPMTVLLATDSLLVGQGLAALFSEIPEITVVGLARDQPELLRLCTELLPQALIVNVRSPSAAAEQMVIGVRQLRNDFPHLGSVLISDCGNGFALELLRDGAARIAYLLGDQLPTIETVVDAVREVTAGQSVLDPGIVDFLVNHQNDVGVDDLTNRETEVLELIAQGFSNRAIADRLNISVKSIEKSVTSIFRNLDVVDLSRVDRRVVATLSYQRARTTGLEKELRRIRKRRSPAGAVPIVVTPRRDDPLKTISGDTALEA